MNLSYWLIFILHFDSNLIEHKGVQIMIELFILKTCPYCKKVLNFLDSTDIKYKICDTEEKTQLDRLKDLGGKNQVPFLYDKDKNIKMYESVDIIEYLKSIKV